MDDVNALLHRLGFDEIRRADSTEFAPLDGQFEGRTTDDVQVILNPQDRDGIAVLRQDGERIATARKG